MSFFEWLEKHKNSRFGDLARDAIDDESFPRDVDSGDDLILYLKKCNACEEAIIMARLAWIEYMREQGDVRVYIPWYSSEDENYILGGVFYFRDEAEVYVEHEVLEKSELSILLKDVAFVETFLHEKVSPGMFL